MAQLKHIHIEEEDHLYSYYLTLCHVYYFYVIDNNESKEEKGKTEGTVEMICSLIFHAINIEGTTIREMDTEEYNKKYKRFYHDMITVIKECCKNEVEYEDFLEILDEIVGAAIKIASAFEKLYSLKEGNSESFIIRNEE
jgi:CRISPR/Cas system-associated endonuclease Cas3-HD